MTRALLIAILALAACDQKASTNVVDKKEVLDEAEAILRTSGWNLRAKEETAPPPPNWPGEGHVAYRHYGTRPSTGTHVRVYAFADAATATANQYLAEVATLDGLRAEVVVRDRFVFVVETSLVLPGRRGPPGQNAAFRALTRAAAGESD